jgi:hypothetical protein
MNPVRLASAGSILVLLAAAVPALAQPAPTVPPSQLDRVERKLDEVLRRLDKLQVQSGNSASLAEGAQQQGAAPPAPALPGAAAGASASSSTRTEDKPGALAVARPAPSLSSILVVPENSVGGFLYEGGPVRLDDVASRGVRYHGQAGVEFQGWLRVREAGRYELGAEFGPGHAGNMGVFSCGAALWLEDRQVGQQSDELNLSGASPAPLLVVLGAELQPGLYKLRLWTACGRMSGPAPITATVLIKAPSDLNLRPLAPGDVVHQEG